MGFSAMKLINEAGIRGTAVISVAQSSARSLVSSSNEGMGPFNMAAFPGGSKDRLGRRHRVDFLLQVPRAGLGSLVGKVLGRGRKTRERETKGSSTLVCQRCFGYGYTKQWSDSTGRAPSDLLRCFGSLFIGM